MGRIIAFVNHKGGTAKTTTIVNTAVILAERNYKTLIIDLDPQGSSGLSFGLSPFDETQENIYEVLIAGSSIAKLKQKVRNNLYLMPSDTRLDEAREILALRSRREDALKRALKEVKDDFDFILIDCNPSMNILTLNAFSASGGVVIPMSCEFLAMAGVGQALTKVIKTGREINANLEIYGVLLTRFDTRTNDAEKIMRETRNSLKNNFRVFDTFIRERVRVREAPRYSRAVVEYSPHDGASADYINFVAELLHHVK